MKDSSSMIEKRGRQGLCTFCDVAQGCVLIGPSGMPVLECEEFRAMVPPGTRAVQESGAVGATSSQAAPSERVDRTDFSQKGLCGNCAIYETCPFSKAEGGIWHCEEYR